MNTGHNPLITVFALICGPGSKQLDQNDTTNPRTLRCMVEWQLLTFGIMRMSACDSQSFRGPQVETITMSASDHDGKKDDKGGAANFSALNLNQDFLQKLKEDGESTVQSRVWKML